MTSPHDDEALATAMVRAEKLVLWYRMNAGRYPNQVAIGDAVEIVLEGLRAALERERALREGLHQLDESLEYFAGGLSDDNFIAIRRHIESLTESRA